MRNKQEHNNYIIEFLITFFLGFFGIHKFMKKDYKMGIIYLFTIGLFCFGWIIDSIVSAYKMITSYYSNSDSLNNKGDAQHFQDIISTEPIQNKTINNYSNDCCSNVRCSKIIINNESILKLNTKFIAFDTETTGLNPDYDRIVELGAVIFENGFPVNKFQSLVNPGIRIPLVASETNHITNEMLSNAKTEKIVYPKFIEFIKDALNDNVVICAHNANFDMKFLRKTLQRLNYDANITYIDTLELSRMCLNGIENHKQQTIATYFDIKNNNAHRADSDAEVCGKILTNLIPLVLTQIEKEQGYKEKCRLNEMESIISSEFQELIFKKFEDTNFFGFIKNASGYIDMSYFYKVIRYKCTSKGVYIILPKNISKKLELLHEECSTSEDKELNERVYFNKVNDLENIFSYIFNEYMKSINDTKDYMSYSSYRERKAYDIFDNYTVFSNEQIEYYKNRKIEIEQEKKEQVELIEQKKLEQEQIKKEEQEEKQRIKEQMRLEKKKLPIEGRKIIQFDDNGNIINKFISISEAVRVTGINSKSIRDAANGVQKHAGRYVWKYDD